MNRLKFFGRNKAGLLAAMFAAVLPVSAAPVVMAAPTAQQVPLSVFNLPTSPKEGRDPFYPSSLRPYQSAIVPSNTPSNDLSSLLIQGFSGVPPHQLVIINNVTFGAGDEAEVRTSAGRIRIHCVQINGDSAVIQANGQEHTLHYLGKP